MDNELISIIVLSYNNMQYFTECIDSIVSQDYKNIELVFSDDGTLNFNRDKVEKYIKEKSSNNIKNIIVNHNIKNQGIVKNYNKAIKLSKGKYIFYIGLDDMLWDNNTLSDIVNYFKATMALIFTGYRMCFYTEDKDHYKAEPNFEQIQYIKNKTPRELYCKLCEQNFIAGSCTPFRRDLIDKYGYLDESYILLEDYPRYLMLCRNNCKIHFMDRPLIKYRHGGITDNTMSNHKLLKDLSLTYEKEIKPYIGGF